MIIIYILILVLIIINQNSNKDVALDAILVFSNNLLPILLPTFILADLLISDKTIDYLSIALFPIFKKIFNINYPKSTLIIIMSYLFGVPNSARLIANALKLEEIDNEEANMLIISFSYLSLPYTLFLFNLYDISSIYLMILYLYPLLLTRFFKKRNVNIISINKANEKLIAKIMNSITKTSISLINILAIIIVFKLLLKIFNITPLLYPYFEPLGGQTILVNLAINEKLKKAIVLSSIAFLGISVHIQILIFFQDLSYLRFLLIRVIISSILFVFSFFY